jgi:hypothetical protein
LPTAQVPWVWPDAMLQQPVRQGEVAEQSKRHRCVVVLHPVLLSGQSGVVLQPQVPPPVTGSHTLPAVPPLNRVVQLEHTPPPLPQSDCAVPATHVPPVEAEQQPPLQGLDASHDALQVLVARLHALPAGQSAAALQPHLLPPVPVGTQAWPLAFARHVPQIGLPSAHSSASVPGSHTRSFRSQHPPLHGLPARQAAPHTPFMHDWPTGQSVETRQPHVPLDRSQIGPRALFEQSEHPPPVSPQAVVAMVVHAFSGLQQ